MKGSGKKVPDFSISGDAFDASIFSPKDLIGMHPSEGLLSEQEILESFAESLGAYDHSAMQTFPQQPLSYPQHHQQHQQQTVQQQFPQQQQQQQQQPQPKIKQGGINKGKFLYSTVQIKSNELLPQANEKIHPKRASLSASSSVPMSLLQHQQHQQQQQELFNAQAMHQYQQQQHPQYYQQYPMMTQQQQYQYSQYTQQQAPQHPYHHPHQPMLMQDRHNASQGALSQKGHGMFQERSMKSNINNTSNPGKVLTGWKPGSSGSSSSAHPTAKPSTAGSASVAAAGRGGPSRASGVGAVNAAAAVGGGMGDVGGSLGLMGGSGLGLGPGADSSAQSCSNGSYSSSNVVAAKERRRERNKVLARKTRVKKKNELESLQLRVIQLVTENDKLKSAVQKRIPRPVSVQLLIREDMQLPENVATAVEQMMRQNNWAIIGDVVIKQRSFTIINAIAMDFPIVYASPGFLALTGYSIEQVLGRNCRFLQGAETDKREVRRMSEHIKAAKDITTRLVNYKRDGSAFVNHIQIAHLRDVNGQPSLIIGIQSEVGGAAQANILTEEILTCKLPTSALSDPSAGSVGDASIASVSDGTNHKYPSPPGKIGVKIEGYAKSVVGAPRTTTTTTTGAFVSGASSAGSSGAKRGAGMSTAGGGNKTTTAVAAPAKGSGGGGAVTGKVDGRAVNTNSSSSSSSGSSAASAAAAAHSAALAAVTAAAIASYSRNKGLIAATGGARGAASAAGRFPLKGVRASVSSPSFLHVAPISNDSSNSSSSSSSSSNGGGAGSGVGTGGGNGAAQQTAKSKQLKLMQAQAQATYLRQQQQHQQQQHTVGAITGASSTGSSAGASGSFYPLTAFSVGPSPLPVLASTPALGGTYHGTKPGTSVSFGTSIAEGKFPAAGGRNDMVHSGGQSGPALSLPSASAPAAPTSASAPVQVPYVSTSHTAPLAVATSNNLRAPGSGNGSDSSRDEVKREMKDEGVVGAALRSAKATSGMAHTSLTPTPVAGAGVSGSAVPLASSTTALSISLHPPVATASSSGVTGGGKIHGSGAGVPNSHSSSSTCMSRNSSNSINAGDDDAGRSGVSDSARDEQKGVTKIKVGTEEFCKAVDYVDSAAKNSGNNKGDVCLEVADGDGDVGDSDRSGGGSGGSRGGGDSVFGSGSLLSFECFQDGCVDEPVGEFCSSTPFQLLQQNTTSAGSLSGSMSDEGSRSRSGNDVSCGSDSGGGEGRSSSNNSRRSKSESEASAGTAGNGTDSGAETGRATSLSASMNTSIGGGTAAGCSDTSGGRTDGEGRESTGSSSHTYTGTPTSYTGVEIVSSGPPLTRRMRRSHAHSSSSSLDHNMSQNKSHNSHSHTSHCSEENAYTHTNSNKDRERDSRTSEDRDTSDISSGVDGSGSSGPGSGGENSGKDSGGEGEGEGEGEDEMRVSNNPDSRAMNNKDKSKDNKHGSRRPVASSRLRGNEVSDAGAGAVGSGAVDGRKRKAQTEAR